MGTEAKGLTYNPGTFDFHNGGGWVSGPIVKNKLFFFFNFEDEANTYPGTTFKANNGRRDGRPATRRACSRPTCRRCRRF